MEKLTNTTVQHRGGKEKSFVEQLKGELDRVKRQYQAAVEARMIVVEENDALKRSAASRDDDVAAVQHQARLLQLEKERHESEVAHVRRAALQGLKLCVKQIASLRADRNVMRARSQSESTSKEEVAALKEALAQSRRAMATMQRSVQQESEKTATMAEVGAKYSASLLVLREELEAHRSAAAEDMEAAVHEERSDGQRRLKNLKAAMDAERLAAVKTARVEAAEEEAQLRAYEPALGDSSDGALPLNLARLLHEARTEAKVGLVPRHKYDELKEASTNQVASLLQERRELQDRCTSLETRQAQAAATRLSTSGADTALKEAAVDALSKCVKDNRRLETEARAARSAVQRFIREMDEQLEQSQYVAEATIARLHHITQLVAYEHPMISSHSPRLMGRSTAAGILASTNPYLDTSLDGMKNGLMGRCIAQVFAEMTEGTKSKAKSAEIEVQTDPIEFVESLERKSMALSTSSSDEEGGGGK